MKCSTSCRRLCAKLPLDCVRRTLRPSRYIPDIKKVKLIKRISPTQSVWTLYYQFPPPVSPRVFTVVQTMWRSEESPKTG